MLTPEVGAEILVYEVPSAPAMLVVTLRARQNCTVDELMGAYAFDLQERVADGWTLVTMAAYPVGHAPGAGFPGMNLDRAMVVATYRREVAPA